MTSSSPTSERFGAGRLLFVGGGVVSQSPQVVRANELSCGALSPYGCELTLRKLEPHADVDFVRSIAASPPTIETFISSGGSPGNQHSPATSPPQQFCVALRANELSLIGGYFAHSLATSSSPIIPETRRRRLIAVGIPTRHRGAGRVRCGVS